MVHNHDACTCKETLSYNLQAVTASSTGMPAAATDTLQQIGGSTEPQSCA